MSRDWNRAICLVALATGFSLVLASCGGNHRATSTSDASPGGQVIAAADASDDLVITFGSQPDPLEKGDNSIQVTVRQADGSPVTDARVTAVFSMPAMPSMNMPAMRSDATLQHDGAGRYRGTGRLSMGGTWNVAITVARGPGRPATRRLSIVAKE
jgi:hypothetical protein